MFIGTSITGAVVGIAIPTYQLWNQPVVEIERRGDKFVGISAVWDYTPLASASLAHRTVADRGGM
jgi:hypothetical protein